MVFPVLLAFTLHKLFVTANIFHISGLEGEVCKLLTKFTQITTIKVNFWFIVCY